MSKRNLLVISLATLLSACGFHLRGTGDVELALKELDVSARNAYGQTVTELRDALQNNGVKVYPGAEYHLILAREEDKRRAASFNSSARTAEYEVTKTVEYEIRGSKNMLLLNDKLSVRSIYSQDDNNLIGSDEEAKTLQSEQRRELVQQLVQKLRLITPEKLDELQATALAKAKAEADALEAARIQEENTPKQSPIELPIPAQ
ncbi:LPS assembly lipoprotein LptE [Pseudomonas sp. 5P_3.1_Bac2]|uniref:LPS-assembly lipoprotein LptE n=1 Tax=Pseudomonas sp. 5P_3.1_Bac2 TaxID=2971617 RepID=UPI0021C6513C|nr:LPS assembly lipoprotein LptE [Pseudomonas sp. 5P_3.1_Bac2]MCU1715609.1 LPS assembly lipoprotein LptE [Pseudomonas sp. 5P_3.1_Bac2]